MNVFYDGSLRDGRIRTCVVIPGRKPIVKRWPNPRRLTSGHSEWLAAKEAAKLVAERLRKLPSGTELTSVVFVGDYENISQHFDPADSGKCKKLENAELAAAIGAIVSRIEDIGATVKWEHVLREFNPAGIHLDDTWVEQAP